MVKSLVNLNENEDQVINIVKAKNRLKNKSEALKLIIKDYEETILEPELKPEFLEKLNKISKEKHRKFSSIQELRKMINNV